MEYQITHIFPNPDESPDLIVVTRDNETYTIIHLLGGSRASEVNLEDKLDFGLEFLGAGVVVNKRTGKDLNVFVEYNNMTPEDIRKKVVPTFDL
jgi:hypothetical protein